MFDKVVEMITDLNDESFVIWIVNLFLFLLVLAMAFH